MALMRGLIERVRRCALPRPLLICTDGLSAYVRAVRETFRDPMQCRSAGASSVAPLAQPLHRAGREAVCPALCGRGRTPHRGGHARARRDAAAPLARRRRDQHGRHRTVECHVPGTLGVADTARPGAGAHTLTLRHGMYLIGTIYNFCTPHESLRDAHPAVGVVGVAGVARTPAMAAGITHYCWTVQELFVVSCAAISLEATQAAWASFACAQMPG